MFARAMLSDIDIIVVNRTDSVLNDSMRNTLFKGLRMWITDGLGVDLKGRPEIGIPRRRTVFINNFHGAHGSRIHFQLSYQCRN